MQYCTACHKAIATIVIMDLTEGSVSGSQHVCTACAEQLGVAQPKLPPKFSPEVLEDLLGSHKVPKPGTARQRVEACPGCGLTIGEFRSKRRLGCPRCYEVFKHELVPLLNRIHEAASHRGRLPTRSNVPPTPTDERTLADLRRRLEEAVRNERYEEAARLRDDLRRAERGEEARP